MLPHMCCSVTIDMASQAHKDAEAQAAAHQAAAKAKQQQMADKAVAKKAKVKQVSHTWA